LTYLGFLGQVNQRMNATRPRTTMISRKMTHMRCAGLALILLAAACAPLPERTCPCPPPKPAAEAARYEQRAFFDLPGWSSAQLEPSLRAFQGGCGKVTTLRRVCDLATSLPRGDEAAARRFFESQFTPYALVSSETGDSGMITGYYEPIIDGSRTPSAVFRHPIYGVPADLVVVDLSAVSAETRPLRLRGRLDGRRLVPYWSRGEIDARGDAFPAPILAWSADPVELFFLQIQGSGQVRLENGERIRVGYADQNGHPYRSLGRHLIDRGELVLEQASMQGIKSWAAANPAKLRDALNQNPSYVFFRELAASEAGPIGALNVPLHAERSLAVDRRFVPLGAPVYLATTFPLSEEKLERLMAAHDTGGAIRGVVRADFYWGTGADAGAQAGRMRQQGRMWLLWPTGEPLPGPATL
jgi:membrane-bound lytic murein transglycosylase A